METQTIKSENLLFALKIHQPNHATNVKPAVDAFCASALLSDVLRLLWRAEIVPYSSEVWAHLLHEAGENIVVEDNAITV